MNSSNPLHYGGSFSPSGKLGQKPASGKQFRTRKRLENICRLEKAGFTKPQIAAMLVISVNRLSYIMKSPDYLITRMAVTHGIVMDSDAQLAIIRAQRKEMLTQLLPPALQLLANEIQRTPVTLAERKHQVSLAQDLMDREGTFAKVSRTEIRAVDEFDFSGKDAHSTSIIEAIRGVANPQLVSNSISAAAIETNAEFANSHTLSMTDQQKALEKLEADATLLEMLPMDGAPIN